MKMNKAFASDRLKTTASEDIGYLMLDNPARKNAVTLAMWRAIPDAIHYLVGEAGVRVIVLSGSGETDFSAGADISEFPTVRKDAETARLYEEANSVAFAAVRSARVPVIAAVRGICYGGAFGLAAAADLRLADETATFCIPAARLGLAYPADAVIDLLHGLGSQFARTALFTGLPIPPHLLQTQGFLSAIFATDGLDAAVLSLARQIADNAPLSIQAAKLAVRAIEEGDAALLSEAAVTGATTFNSAD